MADVDSFIRRTRTDSGYVEALLRAEFGSLAYCAVMQPVRLWDTLQPGKHTYTSTLPDLDEFRLNFHSAMRLKSYPRYLCLPIKYHAAGTEQAHAMFLLADLACGHVVASDPWGGHAPRYDALQGAVGRLRQVAGHLHYLGIPRATSPYYGPQITLGMAHPDHGSALCVLLSIIICKAFLQRLHGLYGGRPTTDTQFLQAFRTAQLDVGASDSPLNWRAPGRAVGAVHRMVRRYTVAINKDRVSGSLDCQSIVS